MRGHKASEVEGLGGTRLWSLQDTIRYDMTRYDTIYIHTWVNIAPYSIPIYRSCTLYDRKERVKASTYVLYYMFIRVSGIALTLNVCMYVSRGSGKGGNMNMYV